MPTQLIFCPCDGNGGRRDAAQFQDRTYGEHVRVHNLKEDGKKATCSVCGTERGTPSAEKAEAKAKQKAKEEAEAAPKGGRK